MKYIKKFNESTSELYEEISKEDFSELVFGDQIEGLLKFLKDFYE